MDALLRMNWKIVEPFQVKATMDLSQIDRILILDLEIRGGQSVDAPFVMKSLRLGYDNKHKLCLDARGIALFAGVFLFIGFLLWWSLWVFCK